jgi:hypothetical protein
MKRLSVLFLSLFLVTSLGAQAPAPMIGQTGDVFAFEAITVSTVAIGFTTATYAPTGGIPARQAFCTVAVDEIRYRVINGDGTGLPTSTVGHYQLSSATSNASYSFYVHGANNVRLFRMIRDSAAGGDAMVSCSYSR